MQDRIKFKVKFKTEDKIEIFDVIDINFESQQVSFRRQDGMVYNIGLGVKDTVLIQCTGIKDEKDKLIYEHDIVKFKFDKDEIIGIITWGEDDNIGWYINTLNYPIPVFDLMIDGEYEIIGNIYENKQLINIEELTYA